MITPLSFFSVIIFSRTLQVQSLYRVPLSFTARLEVSTPYRFRYHFYYFISSRIISASLDIAALETNSALNLLQCCFPQPLCLCKLTSTRAPGKTRIYYLTIRSNICSILDLRDNIPQSHSYWAQTDVFLKYFKVYELTLVVLLYGINKVCLTKLVAKRCFFCLVFNCCCTKTIEMMLFVFR